MGLDYRVRGIIADGLEYSGTEPALGLFGSRLPTVAGRSAPSATGPRPHEPAQPIADFMQTMRPLGRVSGYVGK